MNYHEVSGLLQDVEKKMAMTLAHFQQSKK